MWNMQDMRRIKASCIIKKTGAWMLVRRKGSPGSTSFPKTPRIIKGHVIRGDIRKTIIKIHGAHRAKLAQKKNITPYKTRKIGEQPNITIHNNKNCAKENTPSSSYPNNAKRPHT